MEPQERRRSRINFSRLKSKSSYKLLESYNAVNVASSGADNSRSAFFQLPSEVRMEIYRQCLSRSPVDCFSAIHHDSPLNPARALMLVSRQVKAEAQQLFYQNNIFSLWPQVHHDNKPVPRTWLSSRDGAALSKYPGNINQIALLLSIKRDTSQMCEIYISTNILRNPKLQIRDLYFRICICGGLKWLCETPKDIKAFCIALEMYAAHFPTLRRIHIMYCGQQWPVWIQAIGDVPFPDIVFAGQKARMASGGEMIIKKLDTTQELWDSSVDHDCSTATNHNAELCRLRTAMSWTSTSTKGQQRHVEINYYDSWTALGEKCVRDKPRQPSKVKPVRVKNRLTKKPSSSQKVVTKVKDFVEKVPLGPNWVIHKYHPATKDIGAEDRGSHWRRY